MIFGGPVSARLLEIGGLLAPAGSDGYDFGHDNRVNAHVRKCPLKSEALASATDARAS